MSNNINFRFMLFIGVLMTISGFNKLINWEVIPFESLAYNAGSYCGAFLKPFVGIALVCKSVLN